MAVFMSYIDSVSLNRKTRVLFASPSKMDAEQTKVVFMLHGGGGGKGIDNTCWLTDYTPLQEYANRYGIFIVLPNAPDSMYANSVEGEHYEDLVARELPAFVRNHFRVSTEREKTAVVGMSMGGYGAMRIGLCEPETFGTICCLSAGNLWVSDLSNTVHAYAVKHVFGVPRIEETKGTEHDLFYLAEKDIREGKPLPKIYHACGTQDHALGHAKPTAAWFREHAPEFEYEYHEVEGGKHDKDFWNQWMPYFLAKL